MMVAGQCPGVCGSPYNPGIPLHEWCSGCGAGARSGFGRMSVIQRIIPELLINYGLKAMMILDLNILFKMAEKPKFPCIFAIFQKRRL